MSGERRRDIQREQTRQQLLAAATRLFAERGYVDTTTQQIAEAAGVTERTLFRHFSSKSELVLANWRHLAATCNEAMAVQPYGTEPIEVVRAGVRAFAAQLAVDLEHEPAQTMLVYRGHAPVLAMLETVLALETSISTELANRLQLSEEDLDVRIVANTSIGVLRATGRAYAQPGGRDIPLVETASARLDELAPLFDALVRRAMELRRAETHEKGHARRAPRQGRGR
jgi:AcrR family transcriptional regulator